MLCATSGLRCGQARRPAQSTGLDLRRRNPPAVQDKNTVTFRSWGYPQRNSQGATTCLWKRCTHNPSHEGFSPASERPLVSLHRHAEPQSWPHGSAATDLGKLTAAKIAAGYHSPVCSSTGDAIDRIAAAIDQLASDARDANGEASEAELTARVAALWQLVSDLDPELARRARRYTGPADGDPSE